MYETPPVCSVTALEITSRRSSSSTKRLPSLLTRIDLPAKRTSPTYNNVPDVMSHVGYVWIYDISTVAAPIFSAIKIPSPVLPGEHVDRIFSSISGLYSLRISILEPKPPVARTTPLEAVNVISPSFVVALTPVTFLSVSTNSVAFVFVNTVIPNSSALAFNFWMISTPDSL